MLIKSSKLSNYHLKKLLRCFCEDLTATQTTRIANINRNTANRYYRLFREKIAAYQESVSKTFKGKVELDESYFGGRNKGRRERGTAKIPVFGIFKRNGRVYTQIIRNSGRAEIRPIIVKFIRRGSVVYTDKWKAYDGLVFNGYKHHRVDHYKQVYSNQRGGHIRGGHINGIENFWSFAKRWLLRFNGTRSKDFHLHLKECEFRYNERPDIYQKMLHILKLF